jgi:hypothetical protein
MDVVRECYVLVGQFGRRVLCWVHLIDEADLKADLAEDNLPHLHDFNDDGTFLFSSRCIFHFAWPTMVHGRAQRTTRTSAPFVQSR